VARRVTTPVRGGANFSNTGASVAQAMKRLWTSAFMGPKMAAFLDGIPVLRGLHNIGEQIRAQNAVTQSYMRGQAPAGPVRAVSDVAPSVAGSAVLSNRNRK
jgi:hypothetical protein